MTNTYVYHNGQTFAVSPKELGQYQQLGAEVLSVPEFEQLEQRTRLAVAEFKRTQQMINDDDNPEKTAEVKAYHIAKAKEKMDAEVKKVAAEWETVKVELVALAKEVSDNHVIKVSDNDRQLAEQLAQRTLVNFAATVKPDTQREVLRELEKRMQGLTDAQKTALQPHLIQLGAHIKDDLVEREYRALLRNSTKLSSQELSTVDALSQFVTIAHPTMEHRIYTSVVDTVKNRKHLT